MKSLEKFGLNIPKILLPSKEIPLKSWAVVACDQYTQDREYWEKVAQSVGDKPSTLNLILPEVFLGDEDKSQRIKKIHSDMEKYIDAQSFREQLEGFIYLERTTEYGRLRKGLVVAVDLESYEWNPDTTALIRATEATIPERIPPRMEIRRGAALELPHIMLLVNDPQHRLVEQTGAVAKEHATPVYEGDLMLNAGHISGWKVTGEQMAQIARSLDQIAAENTCADGSVFMFAVGDGNHSLATAKAVWDEYKTAQLNAGHSVAEIQDSPLRYALVEIVNIYDEGLTFEPIHRVLFNVDADKLVSYCQNQLGGTVTECESEQELTRRVADSKAAFGFVHATKDGAIRYRFLDTPVKELAVSRMQPVLDVFIKATDMNAAYLHGKEAEIDYIHGTDEVFRLGTTKDAVTILLPPIAKDSFFATIAGNGPLPRKSFSMGEASEKRFYLEARCIKPTQGV